MLRLHKRHAQRRRFREAIVSWDIGSFRENRGNIVEIKNNIRKTAKRMSVLAENVGEILLAMKSALGDVSAQIAVAPPPAPTAWAAPHPSPVGDTFPSRGRLCCASKFYVNITRVSQILIDMTKVGRNGILTIRILFRGSTHRRCEIEFRPPKFVFRGNTRR